MVIRAAHKTCFRLTFLTENDVDHHLQRPFILHQLEEGEVAFRQKVVASERRPSFENPQQRTHASHVVLQRLPHVPTLDTHGQPGSMKGGSEDPPESSETPFSSCSEESIVSSCSKESIVHRQAFT